MRLIRITKWDRLILWSLVFDPSGKSNPYQYLELISNSRLWNQDFIWFSFIYFLRLNVINLIIQDLLLFFYFDSLGIDHRHCNESVAWFYELRPKQLLCWLKQRFSRPYCTLLWSFDQFLGSGSILKIFNFLHIIASEK